MKRASSAIVATAPNRQHIIETLLADTEQFRQNAHAAFGRFDLNERQTLAGLESDTIHGADFLIAWQTVLLPQLQKLQNNMSDKSFTEAITTNLLLSESSVSAKINQIGNQRAKELIDEFLYQIYPYSGTANNDTYAQQRERARAVLHMPELDITTIKFHQDEYKLYKDIAEQNDVTVIDPYDSFFTKLRKNKLIKAEQKKADAYQKKRIQYITERLAILSAMHKGLLVQLHDKQLDLVTIFDLRHQYEKKLAGLSGSQKNNPVKHLAIFETVTQKYISKQTERLTSTFAKPSLEVTKTIAKELETVLLQIFDLTNAEKNQLLLYAKEYRELAQELGAISSKHQ